MPTPPTQDIQAPANPRAKVFDGWEVWAAIAGGVLLLVCLGVGVAIVVAITRRKRPADEADDEENHPRV